MKPRTILATAQTPDGGEMVLYKHDHDYSILINGRDLMHSRKHESELELARMGCAHVTNRSEPSILIGGLGMGYTLAQTLETLGSDATVTVAELMDSVITWNREYFGKLNGDPLNDERVELKCEDVVDILTQSKNAFDTILLDVDNGPEAMTDGGNNRLYGYEGITACRTALKKNGCLAVWSAIPSKDFEQLMVSCGFHVRRYRVPAHKGKKANSHFIWLASQNKSLLPPGGGEPRMQRRRKSKNRQLAGRQRRGR